MVKETLQEILLSQKPPRPPAGEVVRELASSLKFLKEFALVLTGIRRCGKSTLQAQLMRKSKTAFFCNFDDVRLGGMTSDDLVLWFEIFRQIAPPAADVFLDEVQEVNGWQRLVRTLLDAGHRVCVTGSNASLLGAELGRKLTGRHLSHTVWPFSYSEHLVATGSSPGAASLQAFLDDGGFPGFLREKEDAVLNGLLRDVLLRDVQTRNHLREVRHVQNLFLFLAANTGQPISRHALTKNLEIPSVDETSRYLEYLQDAYLLFPIPKFSQSFKKRVIAPPKYYCVDNGLRRIVSPQATPDYGRRLENAVAIELLRRGKSPCHDAEKDTWECDFVTSDTVYQVCWQLTEQNIRRELRGALAAKARARAKNAILLTLDQSQTFKQDNETVKAIPSWKWLTQKHQ